MLTCINITIRNNQYRGGIEIISETTGITLNNVTAIRIKKKEHYMSVWTEDTYVREIAEPSDLSFALFDMITKSNTGYTYSIDVMSGNRVLESQTFHNIECWFDGMFVGNDEEQYLAIADYSVSTKRNTQVEYVTTLSGRTPYRVSNANTNYTTGTASGLFFELDENGKYEPDYDHRYSQEVVDFLTDGTNKILKTGDGQIWCISVDEIIDLPFHERFIGKNNIEFNWTEISDVPVFGMVVDDE